MRLASGAQFAAEKNKRNLNFFLFTKHPIWKMQRKRTEGMDVLVRTHVYASFDHDFWHNLSEICSMQMASDSKS